MASQKAWQELQDDRQHLQDDGDSFLSRQHEERLQLGVQYRVDAVRFSAEDMGALLWTLQCDRSSKAFVPRHLMLVE